MCIRSQIILIVLCSILGCKKKNATEFETPYVDTAIYRSEHTTEQFKNVISDVDSVEQLMWISVGNKIDSLKDENEALKKRLNWRPKVVDKDGNVKLLPTLEELRNRKRKQHK